MAGEHPLGDRVLAEATRTAKELLGERLLAAFAIGSLAHGGFSPSVSDIDVALIVTHCEPATASLVRQLAHLTARRCDEPLASRLSIFWADWRGVHHGAGARSRLPEIDRLDLLKHGRLLHGRDNRSSARPPSSETLVRESAQFAVRKLDDAYLGRLRRPPQLVAEGPRTAAKVVLFPVRFLYLLHTGTIDANSHAAIWYQTYGRNPDLVRSSLEWRDTGIENGITAARQLEAGLVDLHSEFATEYSRATRRLGEHETANQLDDLLRVLDS